MASTQNRLSASEVFAIVQQISSQIKKDRIQEISDKAKDLNIKDIQLIVDLLSIALEKNHHVLKKADCVLALLAKIALSANVIAHNRIINFEHIASEEEHSHGDPRLQVEVVRRGTKNIGQTFNEDMVSWTHLSHANILPVYGVFLEGEDGPISLVSPRMAKGDIVSHAKLLSQTARIPLICDVIEGLRYLHSLNLVHGALNPQNVLILHGGRALITGLNKSEQDSDSSSVRYSAPEVLEDDGFPTTASDIWSLGCLIYEVLCGKVPFHHTRQEVKVGIGIATGKKPVRPRSGENGVEEIEDTIWRPVSTCWESEVKDRPDCSQLQKAFMGLTKDYRPAKNIAVKVSEEFTLDFEHARSLLMQIIDSNLSMPPPSKIPEHLLKPLSVLSDSLAKAETVAAAAKKLSRDDTQILIDILDLVIEENPVMLKFSGPVVVLLRKLMMSTHIVPQRYKVNRILHDSTPIAEGDFGKVYKGRDFDVCVSMAIKPSDISNILKYFGLWARSSHPNILPLYGVFHEDVNEVTRFSIVTPYMKNGLLRDYAPRLPQKDRVLLIFDIIKALVYLQGLSVTLYALRGDRFLISDEGRALFDVGFVPSDILGSPWVTAGAAQLYALRFDAPERAKSNDRGREGTVWSLGCLVYEVLSRKVPYHQHTEKTGIQDALSRKECPKRPSATDDDVDEISDPLWEVIVGCCAGDPVDRLTLSDIEKLFVEMDIRDNRPGEVLPGAEVLALRSGPDINWNGVERMLGQIHVERLRVPLSKLIQNHTKDAAAAAMRLDFEDLRTLVDFLDLALKNHLTLSDERSRVLALLSRVTTLTNIFPRPYELKAIKYHPCPTAEGGYGTVHRGMSDPNVCVKVMTKVDSSALMGFVKELILWAHSSHPNVLPFYGVFVDDSKRICLVSPFMNKGNLHDYAPQLAQKDRIPLLHDVIKGLIYLHGLGVVHTDLKGENVLISDEGHALITDFGASHVITATAKGGATTTSVASTLRFTAPEIVLNRHSRPTQECDIWAFGCLCYEVLSRRLPYFEYVLDAQIYAALSRKQLPKRPNIPDEEADDNENWDDWDEPDWDEIDDPGWNLITKCCTPKPGDRLKAPQIEELIVDLKMWDSRPEASGGHVLSSLRSNSDVNLDRAGELLNQLLVWLLARNTLRYRTEIVISAAKKLKFGDEDVDALLHFWDLVLQHSFFTTDENNQALALLSALTNSTGALPYRYILSHTRLNRRSIGSGSFGTVHRGSDPNLFIKATDLAKLGPDLYAVGDVIEALMCLHGLGIVHGNLKGENVLVSDEDRALVADFRPYHVNVAAAEVGLTGSHITSTLRFTAPELVKARGTLPTVKSDIWSIGCLIYLVLTRKVPFYQYSKDADIRSALSRGVHPARPVSMDNNSGDEIDDKSWDFITKCCALDPDDRFTLSDIQKWLTNLDIQDSRPPAKPLPGAEVLKLRLTHHGVDVARAADAMARIISELPPIIQDGEKGDDAQGDTQSTE